MLGKSASLYHFDGEIEVTGQSNLYKDRVRYTYIQFIDTDGNVKSIKHVNVGNSIDANIKVGTKGRFYLVNFKGINWIFAVNAGGRKIFDEDDIELNQAVQRRQRNLASLFIIWGVICSPFVLLIGLPCLIYGVILTAAQQKELNELNVDRLRDYFNANSVG